MSHILLLNGPNLNMLGIREPNHYGCDTLPIIEKKLQILANEHQHRLTCYQSNAEFQLIETIHQATENKIDYILFNPAAFTHTSIALRDALLVVNIPFIEIHLSNIYKRESFRHNSYFSDIAEGVISGLGTISYTLALQAAITALAK